ncbi:MAG TPA: S8 family serine peptidase [Saprospiraceae bacterium]|nr:S8 family serine peptidase [Saprospiraceae bacterium]
MRLFALTLLSLFISLSVVAQSSKIDPSLLGNTHNQNQLDYIVLLSAQADLTAVSAVKGKTRKGNMAYNLLKKNSDDAQLALVNWLRQRHIEYTPFFVVNGIHVRSDYATLLALADRKEVQKILPNFSIKLDRIESEPISGSRDLVPEWGLLKIGADSVWRMGFDGKGVVVGGQDTGYDWSVSPLKIKYKGFINDTVANHSYHWHDAIHQKSPLAADSLNPCGYNLKEPCDDNNHGTHTMGTMVGSDTSNLIGVAPGAQWIACRNMERGNGQLSTYLECFEWFLAPTDIDGNNPDPTKAPHVINNSWYCSPEEGCNPGNWDALQIAVKNLKAAGVVVVVSAGNSGPGCETINAPPAHFEPSFSVGASMINDTIANFSSRGPVSIDSSYRVKPDVVAPGRGVRSVVRGGGFAAFNGTSMAGPHVAGLVALIISANPDLAGEVTAIEEIIRQTADPKFSDQDCGGVSGQLHPNAVYGYGRINAIKAVELALKTQTKVNEVDKLATPLKIIPNPASASVIIGLEQDKPSTAKLSIFNAAGVQIWEESGRAWFQLSLDNWPAGLYQAVLENEHGVTSSASFVVQH